MARKKTPAPLSNPTETPGEAQPGFTGARPTPPDHPQGTHSQNEALPTAPKIPKTTHEAQHSQHKIVWEPHPGPQTAYCSCPVFEIFFGGARGGGKTDAALGRFALRADMYGENAIGIVFRRKRTELVEAIERSKAIYKPLGAKFNEQDKLWRFPNGARLRFAYLENDSDADNYQGHNYSDVIFEEIGTFPSPTPVMKMMATLRQPGIPPSFCATGNPGGPGHQWVKARYVDWAPKGNEARDFEFKNPFNGQIVTRDRVFIPSKLSDNPKLGAEYVANLYMSGSASLVKAWLIGDWNVVQGAYFGEFGDQHIIEPFAIPRHWLKFRAMDWGSYRPYCVLWAAVSDGSLPQFPPGALIVYRELYGIATDAEGQFKPNEGVKEPPDVVARKIRSLEAFEHITYGKCDPAMAQSDGGPSIMERMAREKCHWTPADNKRIPGWNEVRARLRGNTDGQPMLYVFSTCTHLIRTLPAAQHDDRKPEDLDTEGEDHAIDAARYLCMSRPYIKSEEKATKPVFLSTEMPIDKIIELAEAREARRTKI